MGHYYSEMHNFEAEEKRNKEAYLKTIKKCIRKLDSHDLSFINHIIQNVKDYKTFFDIIDKTSNGITKRHN